MLEDSLVELLVNEKFGAANTNAIENLEDILEELDVVNRSGQTIVAEMAGAVVIRLTARATGLSVLQHTHARVKETPDLRL